MRTCAGPWREVISATCSACPRANVLETTPVWIDSALLPAHKTVDDRVPSHSQQQMLRLLGDEQLSDLVERYITAWEQTTSTSSSRCSPKTPES